MKKTLLLFSIILLFSACPPLPQHIYDKVEYKAVTRGTSESILIERKNKKEAQITYTKNNQKAINRALTKEEFHLLFDYLRYLNINGIHQLEVPSKKHQYDGAMISHIFITAQDKSFKSPSFDHDNPPKELKPLIDYLKSLIQ